MLWSPVSGPDHAPLVLMGHGGGLRKKTPALAARACDTVTSRGLTVAAIAAPGHGDRTRTAAGERARAELRQAQAAGETGRLESVSVRYGTSLAQRAVPEWRATLDALQELPGIGTQAPAAYGGGISLGTAIGVPLTAVEPRITAAIFGGGFFVHAALIEAARRVTVPVQFLLPWDDEHAGRQSALALSGAFAFRKDAARQPGRSSRHPLGRGQQRVPDPASRQGRYVTGLMGTGTAVASRLSPDPVCTLTGMSGHPPSIRRPLRRPVMRAVPSDSATRSSPRLTAGMARRFALLHDPSRRLAASG